LEEVPPESLWRCAAERITHPPLDSRIISGFPQIFAEFRGMRFKILWRGSRDGFGASEFHLRCDGRANTLTVSLDTEGNVFGRFTPVEWESRVWNGIAGWRIPARKVLFVPPRSASILNGLFPDRSTVLRDLSFPGNRMQMEITRLNALFHHMSHQPQY
jgi:hypothetical protein